MVVPFGGGGLLCLQQDRFVYANPKTDSTARLFLGKCWRMGLTAQFARAALRQPGCARVTSSTPAHRICVQLRGEPANDPKQSSFAIVDGMLDDAHQAVVGIFAGTRYTLQPNRVSFQFRHPAPWDCRKSLMLIARADGALSATRRRLESAPTCAASTFDQTCVQPAATAYATSKVEERVSPRSTMAPSRGVALAVGPF